MTSRLQALRAMLEPHVHQRAHLVRALAPLAPLFAAADSGDYRLATMATFDHDSVKMAITAATGRRATGLLLLAPAKMAPAVRDMLRWRALGDALRGRFEKSLRERLDPSFKRELDLHVQDAELALAQALIDGVWDDAHDRFADGPPEDTLYGIRTAIWCYAALVALGDDDARSLAPLVRLLSAGVLIGESVDLPDTWVLLTAPQ